MLQVLQSGRMEYWILLGLGLAALILWRIQRIWDWEDLWFETVRKIEVKLQVLRRHLRRMILVRSRADTDWRHNPSYGVEDFLRDLQHLIEFQLEIGKSPSVADLLRGETPNRWGVLEIASEDALGYSAADPRAWDYRCRFVAVLEFLRTYRDSLIATPEKIVEKVDGEENDLPFQFDARFLEFLLGGFEDPILPAQEGWHPLLTPWSESPYEAILVTFRQWLAAHRSPASAPE